MANILHNMDLHRYESLAFFSDLDRADLEVLSPCFDSAMYVAGTTIFEQGDKADRLHLVASGEVSIRYKPDDGPVMTVTRVQPGSVFGWSAAAGNARYTSSAVCSLDSEILSVEGDDLRRLFEQNPRIGNVLNERLSLVVADRRKSQQGKYNIPAVERLTQGNSPGGG